ncbi:MAG TPA: 30S ribosomal protein S6e [Candidatus Bathyarchaeia archaeon]|nr:30S ribosomal protein S6e [Candidatus Bathyarchaeia archaeon]
MAEFRLIISDAEKKSAYKMEVSGAQANKLFGLGIGDSFDGDIIGLGDYTLVVSGGSDKDGVAMRRDLPGTVRKRLLLSGGVGYHPKKTGIRRRKSVRGRVISAETGQINLVIEKSGVKPLDEILKVEKAEE